MIVDYNFVELGIAYLCGIMMPGPSLTLLIRNSLLYARSTSIQCSAGIVVGIALQAGIILIGTNFLDIDSIIFTIMRVASALFLIYLGINSITCLKKNGRLNNLKQDNGKKSESFVEGVLLEVLNPLALTFFISILTSIVDISVSADIKLLYWAEIIILGILWFCGFALLTSSKRFVVFFSRFNKFIGIASGFIFLFIGFSVLGSIIL
jgi:threonine/homoserine/homoserine lactone efflux protein